MSTALKASSLSCSFPRDSPCQSLFFLFFNSLSLGSHDVDVKTFYFAVLYARLYRLFHAVAITRAPFIFVFMKE